MLTKYPSSVLTCEKCGGKELELRVIQLPLAYVNVLNTISIKNRVRRKGGRERQRKRE